MYKQLLAAVSIPNTLYNSLETKSTHFHILKYFKYKYLLLLFKWQKDGYKHLASAQKQTNKNHNIGYWISGLHPVVLY